MSRPRLRTIRFQLLLGIVSAFALIGGIVFTLLPRLVHGVMERSEQEKLGGVAATIAQVVAPALDFEDPELVEESLEYFFKLPEIYGIEVYDADGEIVCAAGDPYPIAPSEQRGLLTATSPVVQGRAELGRVVLITRSEALAAAVQRTRLVILGMILFAVTVAGLVATLLANYILRPVGDLHKATKAITDGDLGARVPIRGSTELADLATAFNVMLERLRATTTSRDNLEKEVEARQRALEEIQRLKERAETLAKVKSEFLANMSHEIRTPMNGILGLTELALDSNLDTSQRTYLNGVLEAGRHLLAILNDVLDLSKIEAGKLEISPVTTDLAELICSLGIQHGTVAHSKGIHFHVALGPEVPRFVVADGLRIRQILANLTGNAIKFTSNGHVRIQVSAAGERGAAQCQLRFSVKDTGIGVPPSKREAIFQPFQQADGSTTRNFGGTGLGLTISLRLANAMGGKIELDSEPSQGSDFHFTLTFPRAPLGEEPAWSTSLRGIRPRVHIELVDPEIERTIRGNLGFWGAEVVEDTANADLLVRDEATRTTESPSEATSSETEARAHLGKKEPLPFVLVMGTEADTGNPEGERRVTAPFGPLELGTALWGCLGGRSQDPNGPRVSSPDEQTVPLRVLVAEDNTTNQMVITRMLERLGHEVVVVENGSDAVDRALHESYDIVLMDWHMPIMNGLEATADLRRRGSRIRIVALTANALPGDRDLCLEAGMNGYLSKPIRRADLEKLLADVARGKEGPDVGSSLAA
ncbi:MAG: ATP-binding protein [Candidatus Eisenbacteria bacterium]